MYLAVGVMYLPMPGPLNKLVCATRGSTYSAAAWSHGGRCSKVAAGVRMEAGYGSIRQHTTAYDSGTFAGHIIEQETVQRRIQESTDSAAGDCTGNSCADPVSWVSEMMMGP
jgi:hypothetical protein